MPRKSISIRLASAIVMVVLAAPLLSACGLSPKQGIGDRRETVFEQRVDALFGSRLASVSPEVLEYELEERWVYVVLRRNAGFSDQEAIRVLSYMVKESAGGRTYIVAVESPEDDGSLVRTFYEWRPKEGKLGFGKRVWNDPSAIEASAQLDDGSIDNVDLNGLTKLGNSRGRLPWIRLRR